MLMTPLEVAAVFRINRSTAYPWIEEGLFKAVKLQDCLRIPRTEVERLQRDSFDE